MRFVPRSGWILGPLTIVEVWHTAAVSLRAEVQIVREILEGALAPSLATAVLFDALDRWGRAIPVDSGEVLELVHGPLGAILAERLGPSERDALVRAIEERLATPGAELELEIDLEETEETRTTQMAAVPHPVSVLVASAAEGFAKRLLTAIGEERVYPHTVGDEASMRHATFSVSPLVAVVDASAPPDIRAPALAAALRGLPDRTLAMVWGEDTPYGRELRARLDGSRVLFLARAEGIEPLLDVVLSRFERLSSAPPPSE